METNRRRFISLLMALPMFSFFWAKAYKQQNTLLPTPPCDDHDEPTPPQMEGPYFKPQSPEKSSFLEQHITGTALIIRGQVLNTKCQPVARALLDWWHADDKGEYDNSGFKLRGHQYTNAQGSFRLETIVPGIYTGRTRHLHVKLQAPGKEDSDNPIIFSRRAA